MIMDKIREEHKKGLPSKRKILSNLLDLLNKDKHPSLSDHEFYNIVGETYKLNLNYKLNLKMLFYPIYNALNKRIKKLYGDEKRLEIEQYLIKNFGLFGTEHILNKIKEEFEKTPSEDLISLYWDLRQRMGINNRLILDKYVIEKYNLIGEEHIIYACNGNIKLVDSKKGSLSLTSGSIFLTNYRIIAQGIHDAKGPLTPGVIAKHILSVAGRGLYRRPEATELLLESSLTFGYQFPSRDNINLKKRRDGVSYSCIQNNQFRTIQIKLPLKTSQAKREEQIDIIFKILGKDVNHIQKI